MTKLADYTIAMAAGYSPTPETRAKRFAKALAKAGMPATDLARFETLFQAIRAKRRERRPDNLWRRNVKLWEPKTEAEKLKALRSRLKERREEQWEARKEAEAAATRRNLLNAGAVARDMGLNVRASKGRDGRISSYYVSQPGARGAAVRISDHEIPWTPAREAAAAAHGDAMRSSVFAGDQILVDHETTKLRVRRLLTLALNGRSI